MGDGLRQTGYLTLRETHNSFYGNIFLKGERVMNNNTIRIEGLLLTGKDAVLMPCLAIIGAATVATTAIYVGHKLVTRIHEKIASLEQDRDQKA